MNFFVAPKYVIRRYQLAAIAVAATAVFLFLFVARPTSASVASYEARLLDAESRLTVLEAQRTRYEQANISVSDLESPVPSLSDTSGSVKADIKLAVFSTLTAMGMTSPDGMVVTESAADPQSNLIGFSTAVALPGGFDEVDVFLRALSDRGYLVAVESLSVAAERAGDISDNGTDHEVSLGLVFWFVP